MTGRGTPDGQTNKLKALPFRRTTYACGKDVPLKMTMFSLDDLN